MPMRSVYVLFDKHSQIVVGVFNVKYEALHARSRALDHQKAWLRDIQLFKVREGKIDPEWELVDV